MTLRGDQSDALFVSQTGSGKTLMFLLPMLEQLAGHHTTQTAAADLDIAAQPGKHNTMPGPHGLIIVPTPDLAVQVTSVVSQLAASMPSPMAVKSLLTTNCGNSSRGGTHTSGNTAATLQIIVATVDQVRANLAQGILCTRQLRVVAIDEVDAVLCAQRAEDVSAAMERAVDLLDLLKEHRSPRFLLATAHLSDTHEKVLAQLFPAMLSVRHTVSTCTNVVWAVIWLQHEVDTTRFFKRLSQPREMN